MKRRIRIAVVLTLCAFLGVGLLYAYGGSETAKISYTTVPHMGSIHVKWDRKWGVRHYDVYRADVTGGIYTTDYIGFDEYEKIGGVSGLHASFDDESVENGHYYSYVIRGFSRGKVLCDSSEDNLTQYECAGLAPPDLGNNGYGENNENTPERIYLYVQYDTGVQPDGVQVYRKADGDKEFTQIAPEELKVTGGDGNFEVEDGSVRPGGVYTYKVRTFAGEGDEQIVSSFSDTVRIPAVNFVGRFTITGMDTQPGAGRVTITVKSHKYNGALELDKGARAILEAKDDNGKKRAYELMLDTGKTLKAGNETDLTFTCRDKKNKLPKLDRPAGFLTIEDEGVYYDMGTWGYSLLKLDLDEGTGTIFVDYDN